MLWQRSMKYLKSLLKVLVMTIKQTSSKKSLWKGTPDGVLYIEMGDLFKDPDFIKSIEKLENSGIGELIRKNRQAQLEKEKRCCCRCHL